MVVTVDLTQPGEVERVTNEVRKRILAEAAFQTKVLIITADLARPEDIERMVATTLNEFNRKLDVLVNNASRIGLVPMSFLLDYPLEDFHNVINTNLIAPFFLIKKALPAIIERGGRAKASKILQKYIDIKRNLWGE